VKIGIEAMRKYIGITSKRLLAVTLSMALTLSGSYAVKANLNTLDACDETVVETTADFGADEAIEEDSTVLADDKNSEADADGDNSALETDKERAEGMDTLGSEKGLDEADAKLEADKEIVEEIEALDANDVTSESENPSGLSDEDEEARNLDMNPGLYGNPKIKTYLNTY